MMKLVTLFVIFIVLNDCSEFKENDSEEFPPSLDPRAKIFRDKDQDSIFQEKKFYKLFVGNINFDNVTNEDIYEEFSSNGVVLDKKFHIVRDQGYAFVKYATLDEADRAILATNGKMFHGKKLNVNFARKDFIKGQYIPRIQGPQNNSQRDFNLPPRLHNQQTQKKQEVPNRKESVLNPETSEFVPPDWLKIDLGLIDHPGKRKIFKDAEGNEVTLRLYDKQKGLALHLNTPHVVTEGKIKFSLEVEINISDHIMRQADVNFEYLALPNLKTNMNQSRVAEEVQNQQPSIKKKFVQHEMIQEYKVELNLCKETRSTNKITETVEECKIEHPHHQEKKPRLYKKSSKDFNMKHGVRYVARETKKTTTCGQAQNEFGNQQQSKSDIPLTEKNTFIQTIEQKLENVDTILYDVDSSKPAQLKEYLKEFLCEEDIGRKWKKTVMQKKLKRYLNEKRESLQNMMRAEKTQTEKDAMMRVIVTKSHEKKMRAVKTQAAIDLSVRKLTQSMTREGTIQSPNFFGQIWKYRLEEFPVVLNYRRKMFVFNRICGNVVSFKSENQTDIYFEYKTEGTDIFDAVVVAKILNDRNLLRQPKANIKHEFSRIFETVFEQQIVPTEINLNEIEIFTESMKNIRDVKILLSITKGKVGEETPNNWNFNEGAQKEQERG